MHIGKFCFQNFYTLSTETAARLDASDGMLFIETQNRQGVEDGRQSL